MTAKIFFRDGIPFTNVTLVFNGIILVLDHVLVDTGSGACVFKTDTLARMGILPNQEDVIQTMGGIGGVEYVVEKQIDSLQVGTLIASPITIQMGAMDYGIPMDGILGADFLLQTGAVIDFDGLEIRKKA
jgi:hypothetical protein